MLQELRNVRRRLLPRPSTAGHGVTLSASTPSRVRPRALGIHPVASRRPARRWVQHKTAHPFGHRNRDGIADETPPNAVTATLNGYRPVRFKALQPLRISNIGSAN